jgi:hypothetical protein
MITSKKLKHYAYIGPTTFHGKFLGGLNSVIANVAAADSRPDIFNLVEAGLEVCDDLLGGYQRFG